MLEHRSIQVILPLTLQLDSAIRSRKERERERKTDHPHNLFSCTTTQPPLQKAICEGVQSLTDEGQTNLT